MYINVLNNVLNYKKKIVLNCIKLVSMSLFNGIKKIYWIDNQEWFKTYSSVLKLYSTQYKNVLMTGHAVLYSHIPGPAHSPLIQGLGFRV